MNLIKLLATVFSLIERFFQSRHDDKMRRAGADAAERKRVEAGEEVRREADKVRRSAPPHGKRDLLERM
ncbi:MAG TPA: hypothetical protein VD713_00870 [Sphingomonadales bacterium]|nr:hypothetical protein [Sphingomonadales bacterium]